MKNLLKEKWEKFRKMDSAGTLPFIDEDIPEQKKKKRRKTKRPTIAAMSGIIIAAAVAGLLIGRTSFHDFARHTVVLLDDSDLSCSGINGSGIVNAGFKPEQKGLENIAGIRNEEINNGQDTSALDKLSASITCSFDQDSSLSNGDQITYACSWNSEYAEAAGFSFSNTQKTYTVNGLAEVQVLDLFHDVTASWKIENNNVTVEIAAPESLLSMGISYNWNYGGNDYNGHSVFVEASYDEAALMQAGYIVNVSEKEFEMGNMPAAISSLDELNEEEQQNILDQVSSLLDNDLSACGSYQTNRGEVIIDGYENGRISEDYLSYMMNEKAEFTVTFDLNIQKDEDPMDNFSRYSASYTGTIWRLSDNIVQFYNETVHGCNFNGYFGIYFMSEQY